MVWQGGEESGVLKFCMGEKSSVPSGSCFVIFFARGKKNEMQAEGNLLEIGWLFFQFAPAHRQASQTVPAEEITFCVVLFLKTPQKCFGRHADG